MGSKNMNEIELSLDEIDLSFDNRENDFKAIIKKNYNNIMKNY